MATSAGDGLAEVIYFPGVTAPADVAITGAGDARDAVDANKPAPPEQTVLGEAPPARATRGPAASTRAENIAMHALTRRGRSRRELEAILTARELDPETVEAELERLAGVGLIDDETLAEQIVRTGRERKGLGRAALSAELRRRKIDPMYIDAALDTIDQDSELERATSVAEQRASRMQGLDRDTAVRRLSAFLQRKGYSGDTVRRAVEAALAGRTHTVRFR